jgi:hypothetical protein
LCKHVVGLGIQSKSCKTPIAPKKQAYEPKKVEDHPKPDLGYKSSLYFLVQKEFQSELGLI